MLGAEIAVLQPAGLASLAICNSPGIDGAVDGGCRRAAWPQLPAETQAALIRHEAAGTVTDPEYLAATEEFYRRHVCRVVPTPQDFVDSDRADGGRADRLPHHERPQRVSRPRHAAPLEHHRPAAADRRAHAGHRRRVRRGHPGHLAAVRRADRRRAQPRLRRRQPLHSPGEASGVPRRHRRIPRRPRRHSPRSDSPSTDRTPHGQL